MFARVIAACLLAVAAAACSGDDESAPREPVDRLVIVSDVHNPPPKDEGFLEGIVRLELYLIGLDKTRVRLTDDDLPAFGPDCSPDGTLIAFSGGRRLAEVEVMNVDGSGRRTLARGIHPSWSPDGRELVFARRGGLFLVSAAGGQKRPLLDGRGLDHWPAWSPTGDRIAFLRAPDPEDPYHDVYVVDAEGGEERLVLSDVDGGRVAWSPDGRELAVARTIGGFGRVWIVDAETGEARRLTRGEFEGPQAQPAWSPDGRLIAFSETAGIGVVRPDGSGYRQLPLEPSQFPLQGGIADWVTYTDPDWCG